MTNPATQTALGPVTIIAGEQYYPEEHRLVNDPLAYQILPPGLQLVVKLTRWSPARDLLFLGAGLDTRVYRLATPSVSQFTKSIYRKTLPTNGPGLSGYSILTAKGFANHD